jgi:hypothetical protein
LKERLLHAAELTRAFLAPRWVDWHAAEGRAPVPPSKDTCGRSSRFLAVVIERELGLPVRCATGVPRLGLDDPDVGPWGFHDGLRWQSHSWVVSAGWIVDITADQFGAPPVVVVTLPSEQHAEGPADTASDWAKQRREALVAQLWPSWLASTQRRQLVVQ